MQCYCLIWWTILHTNQTKPNYSSHTWKGAHVKRAFIWQVSETIFQVPPDKKGAWQARHKTTASVSTCVQPAIVLQCYSVDIPLVMYTAYNNAIPLVHVATCIVWAHMGSKQFSEVFSEDLQFDECYYQAKPQSSYYCRKKLTNDPNIIMTLAHTVFCVFVSV